MFLFMFFEIASVKIFFVATFHFTHVLFSFLFFWYVCLRVLLEICRGGKGLAALIANERFLVFMYFFVAIKVGLLIETLRTVLKIT